MNFLARKLLLTTLDMLLASYRWIDESLAANTNL